MQSNDEAKEKNILSLLRTAYQGKDFRRNLGQAWRRVIQFDDQTPRTTRLTNPTPDSSLTARLRFQRAGTIRQVIQTLVSR